MHSCLFKDIHVVESYTRIMLANDLLKVNHVTNIFFDKFKHYFACFPGFLLILMNIQNIINISTIKINIYIYIYIYI